MAVEIAEQFQSRAFAETQDGATLTTKWVVRGTTNELAVYAALRDLPSSMDGLIRTRIGRAEPQGGGLWFADVEYGSGRGGAGGSGSEVPAGESPGEQPPGASLGEDDPMPSSISFSTVGGTAHITQSIKTISCTRSEAEGGGGIKPDNQQAIGLRRDGVDGCDIVAPKMEFSWQVKVPQITFRDMRRLMRATAKTNRGRWKGFEIGELLYLGAEGQPGERGTWVLTHRFAFNENLEPSGDPDDPTEGLIISRLADDEGTPDIVLPGKKGWEYVWCGYLDTIAGGAVVPLPRRAYVEQVYGSVNFALNLGLGA